MGHLSIKQQKQVAVDSIFNIKVEKSMFSNWRIQLHVSFDEECVCLQSNGSCESVEALGCNHEEADMRILLHANHICQSTENVVIHTPDTDVLLIAITASDQIPGSLFIRTGTKNKVRIITIDKVKQLLILHYDL